jgi:sirohydrochlorin cobaltochelatase
MQPMERSRASAIPGIVVVGHGTADPGGAEETRALAALVAARLPDVPVELGFLEVIGPSIGAAVAVLAQRGCHELVAAPLLLLTAGHARRDVPAALAEAARTAGVGVRQSEALGVHPDIVLLAQERRSEAVAGLANVPAEQTALVVMGRGSSDPDGPAQLRDLAAATLVGEPSRPRHVLFGFAAAARPTLDEVIDEVCGLPDVRRVVVQPHLLFQGHVLDQVSAAVARGKRLRPDLEWVEVARLGAHPRVAAAVVDRAVAAAAG